MKTRLLVTAMLKGRVVSKHSSDSERVFIGRSGDCEITLDNPGVSRCHAEITRDGSTYYLTDLGSSNGTTLNGKPVQSEELRDGDLVAIGKFELLVSVADLDAAETLQPGAFDPTIAVPRSRR